MSDTATMHIDGAARGNPGPAAYAIVLERPGQPIVEEAIAIGTATNNVAEYTALVEGLALAAEFGVKKLQVFSDSELMVKQMNGEYRVKNPELLELYQEAKRRSVGFAKLTIAHVRREQNKRADRIGNDALDGRPRRRHEPYREEPDSPAKGLTAPGKPAGPPPAAVTDHAVRGDVLDILRSAAHSWAAGGIAAVSPEAVWDQLWSVLEEGNVLKKKKVK